MFHSGKVTVQLLSGEILAFYFNTQYQVLNLLEDITEHLDLRSRTLIHLIREVDGEYTEKYHEKLGTLVRDSEHFHAMIAIPTLLTFVREDGDFVLKDEDAVIARWSNSDSETLTEIPEHITVNVFLTTEDWLCMRQEYLLRYEYIRSPESYWDNGYSYLFDIEDDSGFRNYILQYPERLKSYWTNFVSEVLGNTKVYDIHLNLC
jgi:hypothetical protein